jgi:RNA polymerase sigma-70 factor (ECF subfamily)
MLAHEPPPIRPEDLLAHAGWLRQLALGLVRGSADPEDLVQATYLAALRSPPEPDLPVRRWLAQVLRNVWKMRVRSTTRRASRETEFAAVEYAEGATSPEALLGRFQTQRLLADLVAELEEPYRSTVLLRYQEGLSSAEIARTQNVPPGTVRWRLMTGLEKLREALDTKNEGDRRSWMAVLLPFGKPLKAAAAKTVSVKLYVAVAAALALAGSVAVVRFNHAGSTASLPFAPHGGSAPSEPIGIPALLPMPLPSDAPSAAPPAAPVPPNAAPSARRPSPSPKPALIARDAPKDAAPTARPADTGPSKPPAPLDPDAIGGTKTEVVNGVLAPGTP